MERQEFHQKMELFNRSIKHLDDLKMRVFNLKTPIIKVPLNGGEPEFGYSDYGDDIIAKCDEEIELLRIKIFGNETKN